MSLWWLFLVCPVAYLIGNVNLSVILSRRVLKRDIRTLASGNPGATNVLRNFGFKWGVTVFLFDVLKGVVPVLVVMFLPWEPVWAHPEPIDGMVWSVVYPVRDLVPLYATGLAVVLGHCFPVVYGFKGGKGVATMVGVFLVISPVMAVIAFFAGVLYVLVFEYGAVASLIFINIIVPYSLIMQQWRMSTYLWGEYHFYGVDLAVSLMLVAFYLLVLYTHRGNIKRLLLGRENKASLIAKFRRKLQKKKSAEHI